MALRQCLEFGQQKIYSAGTDSTPLIVVPRLHSRENFSERVLDVVGAFLNEGSDVYTWWRAGLPYWLVQPLRRQMQVWRVVEAEKLSTLSSILVDPPILHACGAFIGATNFTGNWLSSMVMSVSKHVSGSHLAQLNLVAVPALPSTDPTSSKQPRIEAGEVRGEHLSMRTAPLPTPVAPEKKKRRRHKRRPQASGSRVGLEDGEHEDGRDGHSVPSSAEAPSVLDQPARNFTPPAFYHIPQVGERALRAVYPVKHTEASALYFFPPPFLLDAIPAQPHCITGCLHPERARVDNKVLRYLHNLARMRHFCRARLFDPSLDHRPLTIAEWRTALFGRYTPEPPMGPHSAQVRPAEVRRAIRRQEDRNTVTHIFRRVALMDSYTEESSVSLDGMDVNAHTVETNPRIRKLLLWEAHEINFRAELLALDALIVQTPMWLEIHKWEREALVSEVWGQTSSCVTVIPDVKDCQRAYRWKSSSEEGWQECRVCLRNFAKVLSRWPGCPDEVVAGGTYDADTPSAYDLLQRRVVEFYVRTFVQHFSRLPTPPIALRDDCGQCIIA